MEIASFTRRSPFSGNVNTMTFNISEEEFDKRYEMWQNGTLIQNAFPMLNADEREFIMTGITSQEWDETFGDE
jgi:hypothetical protein